MPDPVVELENATMRVDPGGQVSARVSVRNVGHIIEGFRLEVLGPGVSEWAQVSPAEVRIDVGQSATAAVIFTPPTGSSAPLGSLPFAVMATSLVDASSSAVVEGDIDVGPVYGLASKLTPISSSGRWEGQHRITFSNWGNAPVHLRVSASDPDERLGFLVDPEMVAVPLGGTAEVRLRVRTRKPFLRGSPVRIPFEVTGEPLGGARSSPDAPEASPPERQEIAGVLMQKPIISKWVVTATALVVAALVVLLLIKRQQVTPPDMPADFKIVGVTDTEIILQWAVVAGADGYRVLDFERPTGGVVTKVVEVSEPDLGQLTVSDLVSGSTHCFAIEAVKSDKPSDSTERRCGQTYVTDPKSVAPPENVTVTFLQTKAVLSWTYPTDTSVTGFQVLSVDADAPTRVLDTSPPDAISKIVSQYVFEGLSPGRQYCFQLVALANELRSTPVATDPLCQMTKLGHPATGGQTTGGQTTGGQTTSGQTTSGQTTGGPSTTSPKPQGPVPGDFVLVVDSGFRVTEDPAPKVQQWRGLGFPQADSIVDWANPEDFLIYVAFAPDMATLQTVCAEHHLTTINKGDPLPHVCNSSDILWIPTATASPNTATASEPSTSSLSPTITTPT